MKLIIDIPDQIYDWIEHTGVVHHEDCGYLGGAILDGITIPDNATNGDVIKALFPKGKEINLVYSLEYRIDDEVTLLGILNWWNAPYNRGRE